MNKAAIVIIISALALMAFKILDMAVGGIFDRLIFNSIFTRDLQKSQKICVEKGGIWTVAQGTTINTFGYPNCYFPPSDNNQKCFSDSDCEQYCLQSVNADLPPGKFFEGKCGDRVTAVADCMRHTPKKTNLQKELKQLGCI